MDKYSTVVFITGIMFANCMIYVSVVRRAAVTSIVIQQLVVMKINKISLIIMYTFDQNINITC